MVFYRDMYNQTNKSPEWVNGTYVGKKHGTRLMDALEFKTKES